MEERICTHCGCLIEDGPYYQVGEDILCDKCASDLTAICRDCGERFYIEDDRGDSSCFLCGSCYDDHYTTCERCGRLLHLDDVYQVDFGSYEGDDLCEDCRDSLEAERDDVIHDYYYKPEPEFRGDGPEYLGVELEVDKAGESNSNAQRVLDILNSDTEYAYCKHDGSLEDGFEIVSHPCTLDVHRNSVPWDEAMDKIKAMGYTSHDACTCGLHVHVSRRMFGYGTEKQEDGIARVLYFVEKHWDELLRFSRRTQSQMDQWASRYGYEHNPKDILDKAKCEGRYSAVNLKNSETIEFRMFRGTLKHSTFIATLELVHLICQAADRLTDEDMQDLSWTKFVNSIDEGKYPELVQYLKERGIYDTEDEV